MRRFFASLSLLVTAAVLGFAPAIAQTPGFWQALGTGINGEVHTIVSHGTDVYVGGLFTDVGGNPDADYIVKWNGSGWEALGAGLNYRCRAIAFFKGELYAGGEFVDAGGEQWADRIARWDGTAWHQLAVTGIDNGYVMALAASDDYLYIGGGFNGGLQSNGAAANILRWDGSTAVGLFPAPNNVVFAIATYGTDVYVGGIFLDLGGNTALDCFAKWNGSAWSQMGSTISNEVRAVTVTPAGELYIGGAFLNAGGNPNADRIARWNGTNWTALGTGGPVNIVRSIAAAGSDLFVGGTFFSSSTNLNCIAKWNGTAWQALGTGLPDQAYAVCVHGSDVYAGGIFLNAGGIAEADNIVRWHPTISAAPLPTASPVVLHQNSPNPFNPSTTITFELGADGPARLVIHDARGRLVRTLADGAMGAGPHTVTWDGRDDKGSAAPSGVYFCSITAEGHEQTRKLVLAK